MKLATKSLLAAAMIGLSAGAIAQTTGIDTKGTVGYVIDQRANVAKSGTGLCWRTGYWTPAMAIAECDPDLIKKEAPVVAPPPAPKEAPPPPPPPPAPKPAAKKVTLSADALFDFDKATLRPEGEKKLSDLVASFGDLKLEVIVAVGHADRFGKPAYNQALSERRANAVKSFLVSKGIEPNRVYSEGKGQTKPVTAPDQCKGAKSPKVVACLQPDRRVEIEVIGTKM
jgi:OOP family OmpA-OmpF porin